MTLWPVTRAFTRAFRVGVTLELVGTGPAGAWPLFSGVVSDAELDDDVLALTAAGVLANANRIELAIAGWTAEPWSARAARLLGSTPFPYLVEADPDFDPLLEPPVNPDSGMDTFDTYSPSLVAGVGAALVDTPAGGLLLQALGARPSRPTVTHALDPALVAFAPKWLQSLDVVNVVDVQYGPDDATAELVTTDEASIELYGRRSTQIESDADRLGRGRRRAMPHRARARRLPALVDARPPLPRADPESRRRRSRAPHRAPRLRARARMGARRRGLDAHDKPARLDARALALRSDELRARALLGRASRPASPGRTSRRSSGPRPTSSATSTPKEACMPGNTIHGLPYPLPTDQVSAGAGDIRALAEAVDAGAQLPVAPRQLLAPRTAL